jgi:hypothetical protein
LVKADACGSLFAAAKGPAGATPVDTLSAAQAIARAPWYQPQRVFALLEQFYPVPQGKTMRPVPFMPYLQFAPSAWVLPLKFDGGGYRAGGKAMFDAEGNLWVGNNFTIGWQASDALWQGNASKFDPNGKPSVADHDGFCRRRHAGWHLRRRHRPQGQRLACELWQQIHCRVRQERQAADPARWDQFRRQTRTDAGHHHRAERRRMGAGHFQAPVAAFPEGGLDYAAASSARATAASRASHSPHRSIWRSTSRTASGCRTVRSM